MTCAWGGDRLYVLARGADGNLHGVALSAPAESPGAPRAAT
jgi:hypothetical protein